MRRNIKIILAVWGAISGLLLFVALGLLAYQVYFGNESQHNIATVNDVRFVLNWPNLGDERITAVLNSYESGRSLTGDHLDAYEIETSGVSVEDLQDPNTWVRGDKLEGVLKKGVELISSFVELDELPWFPDKNALMSDEIYVYSWSVLFHGKRATAAKLIFAKPSENKVFYASVKM